MTAYCQLQQQEFLLEEQSGYQAVKHQRFVGTGYFDLVAQTVSKHSSTTALAESTEAEQFHGPRPECPALEPKPVCQIEATD
jgi:isocitrate lyase